MKLFAKKALIISAVMLVMLALTIIGASAAGDSNATDGVASIGDQYYSTLQKAIDDATEGAEITVNKQITVTSDMTITSNKNVTIKWAGTKTTPLFIINGDYNLTITAAEGKSINFQLDEGSLIRIKGTTDKNNPTTPEITLTNVKATSKFNLIVTNYGSSVNPTITTVGGEYTVTTKGTYFLHTFILESDGSANYSETGMNKKVTLKSDKTKFNGGMAFTRITHVNVTFNDIEWKNTLDADAIILYNSGYIYNFNINGGTFESTTKRYLFYSGDQSALNINAKNAYFKGVQSPFYSRKGSTAYVSKYNFDGCTIETTGAAAIQLSGSGYNPNVNVTLKNTTIKSSYGAFSITKKDTDKQIIAVNVDNKAYLQSIYTHIVSYISGEGFCNYTPTSGTPLTVNANGKDIKYYGSAANVDAAAIEMCAAAKIGNKYYLTIADVSTAGDGLQKRTVKINGHDITYYAASIENDDAAAMALSATVKIGSNYYGSLADATAANATGTGKILAGVGAGTEIAFDDGAASFAGENADQVAAELGFVAKTNGKYYADLATAIDVAGAGEVVAIIANITVSEQIEILKNVVIEANGKYTISYGSADALFLFKDKAALTINGKGAENCLTFNTGAASFIVIDNSAKDVDVTLNNVNVTVASGTHIIKAQAQASFTLSVVINGGHYTAAKAYVIDFYAIDNRVEKVIDKLEITNAIIDSGVVRARVLDIESAILTNVTLKTAGAGVFKPYGVYHSVWNITVVGGIYDIGADNLVYNPDSNTINFTATGAIIANNYTSRKDYYAALFYTAGYNEGGTLNLNFTNCTILQGNKEAPILAINKDYDNAVILNLNNTVYGCGVLDENGNVGEITALDTFFYVRGSKAKVSGNFENDKVLLDSLVDNWFVAKVGDWYYNSLEAALAAIVDEDTITIYGTSATLSAPIELPESFKIIGVDGAKIKYTGTDALFTIDGSQKLDITGVTFELGSASLIHFVNEEETATKPTVTLTDVNATSTASLIAIDREAWVDPTITITNGTYTATGKYLIHAFIDGFNSGNDVATKVVTLTVTNATINAGIINDRGAKADITLDGCTVTTGNTIAFILYHSSTKYNDSITIKNTTVDVGTSYVVYACDGSVTTFTAEKSKFIADNANYIFNLRRGTGTWDFTKCEFVNANGPIFAPGYNTSDAFTLAITLNLNDCSYDAQGFFKAISATNKVSLVGTWANVEGIIEDAVNAGIVVLVKNAEGVVTGYNHLDKALAALKAGDTIVLVADIELTAPIAVKGTLNITSVEGATYTINVAVDGAAFVLEGESALNIYDANVVLGADSYLAEVADDADAIVNVSDAKITWNSDNTSADALINVGDAKADVIILADLYIKADKYIVAFAEDATGSVTWRKNVSTIKGGTSVPFAYNENVEIKLEGYSSEAEADAFLRGMSDEYLATAVAEAYSKIFETLLDLYKQYVIYDQTGIYDQEVLLGDIFYIGSVLADVYDEAYAYGYDQAQKNGIIDIINKYLDEATAALDQADAWVLAYDEFIRSESFREQYYETTRDARATIEELRALIANNEELTEETYEQVLDLLLSIVDDLEDVNETLLIALDDAAAYIYEQIMIAIDKATTAIKNFVNAEIDKAMNEFNTFVSDYVNYIDKIFPGSADVINGWLEKYPDLLLGLISKYDFKVDNFGSGAFEGDYEVNEDSYFLAIGDTSLYAELLAKKLGIYDTQVDLTDWNLIDPAKVAKADLITIGYNANRLNGFAVDQMLGFVADYINGDLRDSATAYINLAVVEFLTNLDLFTEEAIEEYVAEIGTTANGAIDAILAYDLLAGKTAESLDWAALVGEENAKLIDEARELIKDKLVEEGISETFTYDIDVVEFVYDFIQSGDDATLKKLSIDKVREKLGAYATYTVEIPVVDALVYSAESYLYAYTEFNINYAKTILSIKEINPDAVIVLLGNYNPINDLSITIGDTTVEIGDIYEGIAATTSVHSLVYALCLNDVVFVDISDAETVFDAYVAADGASYEFIDFITAYVADASITDISEAGNYYIYEQILNALNITCGHAYDNDEDTDCNYCGEIRDNDAHDCVDADNDHKCDVCEETLTECADNDDDHKCDVCGATLTECTDADNDHKCDVCDKHTSTCVDADRNHKCDICGATLTACKDSNRDHRCDTCGARLTNCVDLNKDHKCDTCGAKLSSCIDKDDNHKCDTCGATLTECTDADKDHKCDVCGGTATKCVDSNKDHACDICGAVLNACVDADKDHKCDICGEVASECADADKDHKCDVCGEALSECADANKDHKCDVCDKALSECADANKDHKCDVCDKALTECADANKDHKCDVCDKALSECADANKDHKCDVCDKALSECADADKDHKCDTCGATTSEHDYVDATCETAKTCKVCGATEGEALGHKYDNACDADCNTCGATRTPAAHTYGEWVVTKEATATENGEKQRTCECGDVEKEVIPATGEDDKTTDEPKDGLSGGALAAIIVGSVLVLGAIAFVVVQVVLKKKKV